MPVRYWLLHADHGLASIWRSVTAGAPGVLRLGVDALHRALADPSGYRALPDTARGPVVRRAPSTHPTTAAPVRGLSPHSSPDAGRGGSGRCLRCASPCEPAVRSTAVRHGWSSAETRGTWRFSGAPRDECPSTPHRNLLDLCWWHRQVVQGCGGCGPEVDRKGSLLSKLTVLMPNPSTGTSSRVKQILARRCPGQLSLTFIDLHPV
jgi:hypothetical protein